MKSPQIHDDDGIKIIMDTHEFGPSDEESENDNEEDSQTDVSEDEVLEVSSIADDYGNNYAPVIQGISCVERGESSRMGPTGNNSAEQTQNKIDDGLSEDDYDRLVTDPVFKRVLDKWYTEKQAQEDKEGKNSGKKGTQKGKSSKRKNSVGNNMGVQTIKSPSDTTLYTPALKRATKENDVIQKISNFIESV